MEQTINIEEVRVYTENKLKALFQNDKEFNVQFMRMFEFYRKKFDGYIKDTYREEFKDRFFAIVKSQFFSGYFIIREYLEHESAFIANEWFQQTEGQITEQIPEMIRQISSGDYEEAITTPETQQFTVWAIQTFEGVRSLIKQAAFDIACLGARQALLDERELRGLETVPIATEGLIAPFNELTFISPQTYLSLSLITTNVEKWDLNWWDSLNKQNTKNGEITIIRLEGEDTDPLYVIDVYLVTEINEVETSSLLENILGSFMDRNEVSRENIQFNFANVKDFYIFTPN